MAGQEDPVTDSINSLHQRYETYRAAYRAAATVHPTNKKPLSFKAWRGAVKNEIHCSRCNISEADSGGVVEMVIAMPHSEGFTPVRREQPKLLCEPCYLAIAKGMTACWNEVV